MGGRLLAQTQIELTNATLIFSWSSNRESFDFYGATGKLSTKVSYSPEIKQMSLIVYFDSVELDVTSSLTPRLRIYYEDICLRKAQSELSGT